MTAPRVSHVSPATEARWLDALQRLASRAAHDVRGALNGVSVNLEVIRSRANRPNAAAATLGTFADAAASQLDDVIALTEALLGLSRPAREPVEIAVETRRIVILLSAAARADGRRLTLDDAASLEQLGVTTAPGSAVRLAICESLLASVDAGTKTRCTAVTEANVPGLRIETSDGGPIALGGEIVEAAADSGIDIQVERSAISISFPR